MDGSKGQNPTESDKPTRTRLWVEPFLASLSLKANVTTATDECGINRSTAYDYRELSPEFAKRWDEALQIGVERLEAEAWRRAYNGYERPVYQQGQMVGLVREYSDTLMVTLLKAHAPTKYRERISQEHSGPNGGAIQVERHLTDLELEGIIAGGGGASTPEPPQGA